MTNHSQHDPGKDAPEGSPEDLERDAVWKLLLKARKPEVSPFFARNVLREVRGLQERQPAGFSWGSLFTLPRVAFGGAAAILLAVILFVNDGAPGPVIVDNAPPATTALDDADGFDMGDYQEEIEMIDYLDGLLAVQDIESLDNAALAEILF